MSCVLTPALESDGLAHGIPDLALTPDPGDSMPATARTATQLTHTSATTLAASPGVAADTTNNDSFPNGGDTLLVMNNTAGSSGTVTVTPTVQVDNLAVTGRTYTVPANTVQLVKLGPASVYGDVVTVVCSATSIKLLALAT